MSSVTHELRTPLTSIRAFAELMLDDPQMDADQRQQFPRPGGGRNRAPEPPGQPGAGHGEDRVGPRRMGAPRRSTCEANWCARGADHRRGCSASAARASSVQTDGNVPRLRRRPRPGLLQVLINLLSNAEVRAGGQGRVTAAPAADAASARIGAGQRPGVPFEQQQLVFEKFRQAGDATTGRRAPAWACRSAARSSSISAGGCG